MLNELILATEKDLQNFDLDALDEYNKCAMLFNVLVILRCAYDSTVLHNRAGSCANVGSA